MKPNGTPQPPDGCPITPRTTSVFRVRQLHIGQFPPCIEPDLLCEILPFAHSTNSEGIQWVAVRVTVDPPGRQSETLNGWIMRNVLENLPYLRALTWQAPRDLSLMSDLQATGLSSAGRRQPSARVRRNLKPIHGHELQAAWRAGRRPILRTQAFLEKALAHIPFEHKAHTSKALQLLQNRSLNRDERAEVIAALNRITEFVSAWEEWPTALELESLNPFPEGFFDGIDIDDLFGDEHPDDPL
ncbi:unannotated protein [freshwater metagenome]|uniref:Unannotated protein n=1 Tax=freshwater metagenome TaxID=449393 RepID=A0A6J6DMC1_9ZZZZ